MRQILSLRIKTKNYKKVVIGGTSAGAYLAMMLYFDKRYLSKHNIDSESVSGYIFDAGNQQFILIY